MKKSNKIAIYKNEREKKKKTTTTMMKRGKRSRRTQGTFNSISIFSFYINISEMLIKTALERSLFHCLSVAVVAVVVAAAAAAAVRFV